MTDKIQRIGTKAMVFHGTALATSGGLTRKHLMKTKKGRIVSRKQHALGLKRIKHLFALGYKPTRGKFTAMKKSMVDGRKRKTAKRHTRKRGGAEHGSVSPSTMASAGYAGKPEMK